MQYAHDLGGIVHRKGGLREEGKAIGAAVLECLCILNGFDQRHRAFGYLPECADHFRMPRMANEEDMPPRLNLPFGLAVHFRYQGASRVEIVEPAILGIGRHRFRHAMRGKHDGCASRNFIQFLHKHRALCLQAVHHIAVVDDFMTHIDRRAMLFERQLDNLDRAVDTGAKAARGGEQDLERRLCGNLFSHEQAHLGKAKAKAKDFRGRGTCRVRMRPIKGNRSRPSDGHAIRTRC